jgi:hypothetical protein
MWTNIELKNETDNFRRIWISQIRKNLRANKSGQLPELSVWDGHIACREIKKAKDLWVVLPTRGMREYPFPFLLAKLSREVYLYKWYATKILPSNRGFKKAIDTLAEVAAILRGTESTESVAVAGVSDPLSRFSSNIRKTLRRLEKERDLYWERALIATPAERMTWSVHFKKFGRVVSIPPRDLVESEHAFKQADYPRNLLKRIDLDTRFQVRVATILRHYLPQQIFVPKSQRPILRKSSLPTVSLKTIARLIVLTYVAGNLGREDEENLILEGRKRPINVRNVDEIIRKAGIK